MMKATYQIGDKTYTGAELLTLARMSGLGRWYVGADIQTMYDILHTKGPIGWANRANMNRENAQRLETWVKHLRSVDDPFTAAAKTVRVHFDYSELTDFERVWLRNFFLFYTWMKKNSMLHANGVVMRPGLYQGYADLELNRERFANEPEYYGQQGAITIPGLGNLRFANPMNDIFKWDASISGLRKNLMSAITPPLRIPLELGANTNFFTGAPIHAYAGENKPNFLGGILNPTGPRVEGMATLPARVGYILGNITGPQYGTAQSAYINADTPAEIGQRFVGISLQKNDPEKFAKQAAAKAARAKADATRKRNKEQ